VKGVKPLQFIHDYFVYLGVKEINPLFYKMEYKIESRLGKKRRSEQQNPEGLPLQENEIFLEDQNRHRLSSDPTELYPEYFTNLTKTIGQLESKIDQLAFKDVKGIDLDISLRCKAILERYNRLIESHQLGRIKDNPEYQALIDAILKHNA
jgi:hypothetical protein